MRALGRMDIKSGAPIGALFSKTPLNGAVRPRSAAGPLWAGAATLGFILLGPGAAMAQSFGSGGGAALGGADKPLTVGVQDVTAFDSNPARGNGVNAALRGIKKDDIVNSPSLTVEYSRSSGLQGVALIGNFGYDYYSKNSVLSREHLNFSVIGNKTIGALCSVGGNGEFSRGQSDLQDLTVAVTKNTIQTYTAGVSQTCGTPTGFTESVSVSRSSTQNSSPSLVDFDRTGVSGSLGYSNSTIGFVGLSLSYNRTTYDNTPSVPTSTPDALEVTGIGLQVSRPIGARLSGSAAVYYSRSSQTLRFDAPGSTRTSFGGLTASAGLNYVATPRLQMSVHVVRDVRASILESVGYAVVSSADVAASYTVSSRITASLGGTWSRTTNYGLDPVFLLTTPGYQSLAIEYGRVSVKVGGRSTVSLELHHADGRSDLDLYSYTDNRVSLTLAATL